MKPNANEKKTPQKIILKLNQNHLKMVVFILNLYLPLSLYVIKAAASSFIDQEQLFLEQSLVELPKQTNITYNLLDCKELTEKQFKLMNLLCYNIMNDINSLIESSNISTSFKLKYERVLMGSQISLNKKSRSSTYIKLDEKIVNAVEIYFTSINSTVLQDIVTNDFRLLSDKIKSISSYLQTLQNTISILKCFNRHKYIGEEKILYDFLNLNSLYLSLLLKVFENEKKIFIKKIETAKAKNIHDLSIFKSNALEIFTEYNNQIFHVLVEYERDIKKLNLSKFTEKLINFHKYGCFNPINNCILEIFLICPKIHVISISQTLTFIVKKLKEEIVGNSRYHENTRGSFNLVLEPIKLALENADKNLTNSIANTNNMFDNCSNQRSFFQRLYHKRDKLCFCPNFKKIVNFKKDDNEIFHSQIIELFKFNIRNLIVLKIIIEAVEYSGFYLYECHQSDNISVAENLSSEWNEECNMLLQELKNKIEVEENSEKLNKEEEDMLLHYFLYQKYKNDRCNHQKDFYNNLLAIINIFNKIEHDVLHFYIEILCDNIKNENAKGNFETVLLSEYEEEYLRLTEIFDNEYKAGIFRLPPKLKKLVS